MTKHIGERFEAIITHITASGFFSELENTVEGFVAARTIEDDFYMMTDNGLALEGTRNKNRYTIGDKVKVKVVAADKDEVKVDFEVVGTRPTKPLRSKRKGGKIGKKELTKSEKRHLKEFKEKQYEERQQKKDIRRKADNERYIFENAVVYELFEIIDTKHKFKKFEKDFVGETLKDMAAVIATPIYKKYLFDIKDTSLENVLVTASVNVKNTFGIICDSFGMNVDEQDIALAVKYVQKALRHFDDCMQIDDLNTDKRENEYDRIMTKLKQKWRIEI